jgi:hypothetical protein
VRTPATEAAYVNPRVAAERQQMVPTGRVADPADLANVIAFLASDRAGYINGQDILVDGGLSRILMDRRNVMTAGNSSCVAVRKPVAPFRGELIVLARVIRQCLDTHVRIVIAELVDETVHCRLVPIGSCDQGALGRARPSAAGTPPMNPA